MSEAEIDRRYALFPRLSEIELAKFTDLLVDTWDPETDWSRVGPEILAFWQDPDSHVGIICGHQVRPAEMRLMNTELERRGCSPCWRQR